MHIRNRNDLICWLENNAPFRAIARAIQEGQVENLGAFEKVSPGSTPGWIVKVTSRFKKIWYVSITAPAHAFRAHIIYTVPWDKWIGEFAQNKLYQGDNPKQYKELREDALENDNRL